ncbi:MAG: hypothetical protein AAF573_07625 [Bacteroidota bacterium]
MNFRWKQDERSLPRGFGAGFFPTNSGIIFPVFLFEKYHTRDNISIRISLDIFL